MSGVRNGRTHASLHKVVERLSYHFVLFCSFVFGSKSTSKQFVQSETKKLLGHNCHVDALQFVFKFLKQCHKNSDLTEYIYQ